MTPFDLLGDLPDGTTVLEASAGTGKTYTIAALVARYVAEGVATLDEMLVITFSRMASQELRERVRSQLVAAERALADPAAVPAGDRFLRFLCDVGAAELHLRRRRIGDALADFDAATIATTHQFCQLVLRSLGVAGDSDAGTTLVENLDELVVEVVDDLYLREYGATAEAPPFDRATALRLARSAVGDPQARLAPGDAPAGSSEAQRVRFAELVRAEMDRRKRRLGILSYDDLLSRLATALEPADAPARERMRQRWRIVLVDEFQDTDPVQWNVLERAFHGHATLVLIGDPKQAIYAFRGGDIFTYLEARRTASTIHTLTTNWRSDAPLVDALQVLTRSAELGHPAITVHPVEAHHQGSRLAGAPHPAPLRVRVVPAAGQTLTRENTVSIDVLRGRIAADLADDVARLLAGGATYDGEPLGAGDVAILMSSLKHAHLFQQQLHDRGVPSVVSGGSNVLATEAGDQWLTLLEALEQPQRTGRIRALGLTAFVGHSPAELDRGGDDLTDELAEQVRGWLDLFRSRGIAAVHESLVAGGLAARVLARPQGERLLTDLDHLGQVLHEVSHRQGLGLVALLDWLRTERRVADRSKERTRRLDTDARAVQLLTIHGSKGLQFPVVYLPLAFDCWPGNETEHLFHTADGRRTLDLGGGAIPPEASQEKAGEELRLTYVALTRAQSQVVTWWGPSWYAGHAGTTRLLLGRGVGEAQVPLSTTRGPSDFEVMAQLQQWQAAGAVSGRARGAGRHLGPARGRAAGAARHPAVRPSDRHRVAPHVVLGTDPRRGPGGHHRQQRARGCRHGRRADRRADRRGGRRGARAAGSRGHRLRRSRRPALADGGAARGGDLRLAGPRGPRARRPAGPRPARRAHVAGGRGPALVVGRRGAGRAGAGLAADAAHLARPAGRPGPAGRPRAARPAVRARLRVPAVRRAGGGCRGGAGRDGGRAASPPRRRRPDAGVRRPARGARSR